MRRTAHRYGRGFTVIELALIVAVTAVVGALGMAAFRTYHARAQIAEGVLSAVRVRERVTQAFRKAGEPPANRAAAGLSPNASDDRGNVVSGIDVIDGRIDIRFGGSADEAISGHTLSLTPYEAADLNVVWICGNEIPGVGLKPLGFVAGGRQAVQLPTTIEPRYLPSTCR